MAILLCGHTTVWPHYLWPHYLWPHCCMANRSSSWWCKVESSVFKTKPFLYRGQSQNSPQPGEFTSTVSKWQKDYKYNFPALNHAVCCAMCIVLYYCLAFLLWVCWSGHVSSSLWSNVSNKGQKSLGSLIEGVPQMYLLLSLSLSLYLSLSLSLSLSFCLSGHVSSSLW